MYGNNTKFEKTGLKLQMLQPMVNRQPGFRRGNREAEEIPDIAPDRPEILRICFSFEKNNFERKKNVRVFFEYFGDRSSALSLT